MVQNLRSDRPGLIFDVQRYAIHDGPGIRTLVFMKGCPLRCLWCDNPEGQENYPEIAYFGNKCKDYGRCAEACPNGAIIKTKQNVKTIKTLCKRCGKCAIACPVGARKLIGRSVSVKEITQEVEKDILFYRRSGGGVTVSGGEPLLQPFFLKELLKSCKKMSIDTAIETSGYAEWNVIKGVLKHTDLILYDLKHIESTLHKEYTGVPNGLILANLRKLPNETRLIVRIPLIPGFNDDESVVKAAAKFVNGLRSCEEVHVLPYHRLGVSKYESLGRKYPLDGLQPPTDDQVRQFVETVSSYGLKTKIGG